MRTLTPWHRLLIYFLKEKNRIIRSFAGIDYIFPDDIKEIADLRKDDVKKCLASIVKPGNIADCHSCPWCILSEGTCKFCGYSKRHSKCGDPSGRYDRSSTYSKVKGILIDKNYICSNLYDLSGLKTLTGEVRAVYKILPSLL